MKGNAWEKSMCAYLRIPGCKEMMWLGKHLEIALLYGERGSSSKEPLRTMFNIVNMHFETKQ